MEKRTISVEIADVSGLFERVHYKKVHAYAEAHGTSDAEAAQKIVKNYITRAIRRGDAEDETDGARKLAEALRVAERFQLRVKACACILRADKREKMEAYADAGNVDIETASIKYVYGALKSAVRRGSARNYAEALEQFEKEQDGDNAVSVSMSSTLADDVRKVEKRNDATFTRIYGGRVEVVGKVADTEKRSHKRNVAKVLGALYVQYEERELETALDVCFDKSERDVLAMQAEQVIARYMADYVSRLSPTARGSLRMIIKSKLSADDIVKARDGEGGKMRERVRYLFGSFPARDSMDAADFVTLARQYAIA